MEAILNLRTPKGNQTLNISLSSTIEELSKILSEKLEIPIEQLVIKNGFPPQNISKPELMKKSLLESGFSKKDTLRIEQDKTKKVTEKAKIESKEESKSEKDLALGDSQTPDENGLIMLRRIIDADNNCLFNAISYAIERCFNPEQYRQIISSHVMANTHTFTAPILEGKEPSVYSEWILKNTSWGGALELHIFSQYFALQIAAVSIQTLNVHIFGIESMYPNRIYLIYDGIHYDVLVKNIFEEADKEGDVSIFSSKDMFAYNGAVFVANELKKKNQFTDKANFSIKCGVCYECFKGEKEAVAHAQETSHSNFQEC